MVDHFISLRPVASDAVVCDADVRAGLVRLLGRRQVPVLRHSQRAHPEHVQPHLPRDLCLGRGKRHASSVSGSLFLPRIHGSFANKGTSMPRSAAKIDQLVERVEALEGEVRELRETLTPREKLRRVVERMRQKTEDISQRELNKAIDSALREVRSGRRRA
jgi:hypothetical protein